MALAELDTGVLAWLGEGGHGRPNAGAVVDADGITVVDSLLVPAQWGPFAEALAGLGVPVRRLVLTSSGIEFAGGTTGFPAAAIYGRTQTSVHLDQPPVPDVWTALYPDHAGELAELVTKPVSHIVDTDVVVSDAVTLVATGGQQAENLVAVVAGAAVVFAGAMCSFGSAPLCYQGDPARWADELDRVLDLAPIVVPGHGPIGGEEEVRVLQGYLRACVAAAGDPASVPSGPWDAWADRHHDAVNVERAALLARGEDAIPPSMLRMAGLA
jgi:cyclase